MSADDVFPEHIQARLMQLGHLNDSTSWEIGDLVGWWQSQLTVEDENGREFLINPATEEPLRSYTFYEMAGQYCNKPAETIRDYVYTASRVPQGMRDEFHILGRHHFRALLPHAEDEKELHKLCNQALALGDDYGGGVPPVSVVRAWLEDKDQVLPKWYRVFDRMRGYCEKMVNDETATRTVKVAAHRFLKDTEGEVRD